MNVSNLDHNKKYLLACSYGPDSMALFYLLEQNNISFEVAHVNYHLRKASDKEEKKLRKYCQKHRKVIHVLDVKEKIRGNIESKCREIRYNYFRKIFDDASYEAVLVAHHEDDLIETYLMQKRRQNCPKYYGIAEKTYINWMPIYRPLLDYTKKDLITLCKQNHIPYAIDKSNAEITFVRNEIRHKIVSKMSREERDQIKKEIRKKNDDLIHMFSLIKYDKIGEVNYLLSLDEITYKYTVNRLAEEVLYNPQVTARQCGEIKKILLSNKPNVQSLIHDDLFFIKEYDNCYFKVGKKEEKSYSFTIKKMVLLDNEYFYFDFEKEYKNKGLKKGDLPLTIRSVQKDDQILINGYKTPLRRLFIDWKMPQSLRTYWPVITNKNGEILYIPRYQKDFQLEDSPNFYVKLK